MSDEQYPPLNPVLTGIRCRCPRCGEGPLFKGFLTITDKCSKCGLDYSFVDTADGPAFFVMSIMGTLGIHVRRGRSLPPATAAFVECASQVIQRLAAQEARPKRR